MHGRGLYYEFSVVLPVMFDMERALTQLIWTMEEKRITVTLSFAHCGVSCLKRVAG